MRHPVHDYSSSAGYFITFVTYQRQCFLGAIQDGRCELSPAGLIVQSTWQELPGYYPGVVLDAFQIMPDHVHCILVITNPIHIDERKRTLSLPKVMQMFKSGTARRINHEYDTPGRSVWQKGYQGRVIRDDRELDRFRNYIQTNPQRWMMKK